MDTNLIIRIVVSVIAFANLIASQFGFNPLKLSEQEIYTAVSAIVTLVAWVWGFWKNNNFTKEAKEGQRVIDDLKASKKINKS